MSYLNEERVPVYFIWERDRRVVRCAKYRGISVAKKLSKNIVSQRVLALSEEHLSLSELAAKYPYQGS